MENQVANNFVSIEEFLSYPLSGTVVPETPTMAGPLGNEIILN